MKKIKSFSFLSISVWILIIVLSAQISSELLPYSQSFLFSSLENELSNSSTDFSFPTKSGKDTILVIPVSESNEVLPGMSYEADIILAQIPAKRSVVFASEDGEISLNPGGASARIKIPANEKLIFEGEDRAKQFFKTQVDIILPDGSKQQIEVKDKFYVKKPTVSAGSIGSNVLYTNAGNAINLTAHGLSNLFNPAVSIDNGTIAQSQQTKTKFLICPTASGRLELTVNNRNEYFRGEVGKINFSVVDPPKPNIQVSISGNESYSPGQKLRDGASVYMEMEADKGFSYNFPRDARYKISGVDILKSTSSSDFELVASLPYDSFDKIQVEMPDEVYELPKGTILIYRIKQVNRINFKFQIIEDNSFSEHERSFWFIKE